MNQEIDWDLYKLYNNDLEHMNRAELLEHYGKFGQFENRRFAHELPDDFEVENYRKMNNDLDSMSSEELKKHYTLSGCHERRPYRLTDDPNRRVYIKKASDVRVRGATVVTK